MRTETIFILILYLISVSNSLDCDIIPEDIIKPKNHNDIDRYIIYIQGNPKTYTPYQKYNVSLKVNPNKLPQKAFRQFFLTLESVDSETAERGYRPTGHFQFEFDSQIMTTFSDKCPNTVVENSKMPKWEIQVYWIAPPKNSGCVAMKATVLETRENWFSEDGQLTKILCEDSETDENVKPSPVDKCCACSEAKYEVAFEGRWTRNTHPRNYPSDIWSTKFSDIVGASHRKYHSFWNEQDYASEGLKELAETGSTQTLESEIKVMGNNIRTIIKARGLQHPNITESSYAVFRVDSNNHLVSLVAKITPSPDWFVGVANFELCQSDCTWAESYTYNLYPMDAGTDDGIGYLSSEPLYYSHKSISAITPNNPNNPKSPFYDEDGNPMNPIAKLHFTRQRLYEKPCDSSEEATSEDDCATTEWGSWTPCSVPCGLGKITRIRQYVQRKRAKECYVKLVQHQTCQGTAKYCKHGRYKAAKHAHRENESEEETKSKGKTDSDENKSGEKDSEENSKKNNSENEDSGEEKNTSDEKGSEEKGSKAEESEEKKSDEEESEKKDSEEKGSDEKESKEKKSDEKESEGNESEEKASEEKASDEKDSEEKASEEKDSEGKASEEKDSNEKASEDKDSEEKDSAAEKSESEEEKDSKQEKSEENNDCEVGKWSDWSSCSVTCGKGTKTRDRKLLHPENEDKCEDVELQENIVCKGSKSKCNEDTEQHCSNSNWGPWSTCSVSCGYGIKRRLRLPADNKHKSRKSYEKGEEEEENCSNFELVKCYVDCSPEAKFGENLIIEQEPDGRVVSCKVSEWSIWSKCKSSGTECGKGTKKRFRQILRHPENGGQACPRKLIQQRQCDLPCKQSSNEARIASSHAPTQCIMSDWTDFTPCSSICGASAMQLKTRKILYKPPGAICPPRVLYKPCNLPLACTSDGRPIFL